MSGWLRRGLSQQVHSLHSSTLSSSHCRCTPSTHPLSHPLTAGTLPPLIHSLILSLQVHSLHSSTLSSSHRRYTPSTHPLSHPLTAGTLHPLIHSLILSLQVHSLHSSTLSPPPPLLSPPPPVALPLICIRLVRPHNSPTPHHFIPTETATKQQKQNKTNKTTQETDKTLEICHGN
jgi:hypothetical protein